MIDPITLLVRKIALHKHHSTVPTGIIPLDQIRKATVFVDNLDADADHVEKTARQYFEKRNIDVRIINAKKWDIGIFGCLKRHKGEKDFGEDLFISTAYAYNFTAEYAARCSTARFKVGREQLQGNLFDIVIKDPEGQIIRQPMAFKAIIDLLEKIQ